MKKWLKKYEKSICPSMHKNKVSRINFINVMQIVFVYYINV